MEQPVLDTSTMTPLYILLANHIRAQIEDGKLAYGKQIPSETQLMEMAGVSRITVRKAVERLEAENILVKRRGKGTFVAFPEFSEGLCPEANTVSFTNTFLKMNMVPTTRIIARYTTVPRAAVCERMGIAPGEEVVYIARVRHINGYPALFEEDYLPMAYAFLLVTDLDNRSLLDVMSREKGVQPSHFQDTFGVKRADEAQARYLDVPRGEPLLYVSQVIMNRNGAPLYYNEQLIRSEVYKYTVRG